MSKSKTINARIKRTYVDFLRETLGRSEASLLAVAAALNRFDDYNSNRDFRNFHIEQAKGFKAHLAKSVNAISGERLSASTTTSTLNAVKMFFKWLASQPGYKRNLKVSDADYFNAPTRDVRIAGAKRSRPIATLEQIDAVLRAMPIDTDTQKRDRAVIAFAIVSGARDGAIASFKLKHVNVMHKRIEQDARDVATKQAKTFTSFFFPVGDLATRIVLDWITFLRTERLFGESDPLFPSTDVRPDKGRLFTASGLTREHWSSAAPIRRIFKEAFERVGLPAHNPHSFRNTLVQLAYKLQLSPEQFKAWSQNLGHSAILTTFSSYGNLSVYRQEEVMGQIFAHDKTAVERSISEDDVRAVMTLLQKKLV